MTVYVKSYTPSSPPAWACESCGALVADRRQHDIFHRALRETKGFSLGYQCAQVWARIREVRTR